MNLIWHLAKKDLRRAWIPLALFALFIATKIALGLMLMRELEFERVGMLLDFLKVAATAEYLFGYVLVAVIIHEDPTVGTNAFWMTRPISGLRLLGTKILTLAAALMILPVVITLPWWIACGFDARDVVSAMGTLLWMQTSVIAIALPFAVLTSSLAAYLAASLIYLVGSLFLMTSLRGFFSPTGSPFLGGGASDTKGLFFVTLLTGTVVCVLIHQYRTRLRRRSLTILGLGIACAFMVLGTWRWDWSPLWRRESPRTTSFEKPRLDIQSANIHHDSLHGPQLHVRAWLSGIPPECATDALSIRQDSRWPDGSTSTVNSQMTKGHSHSDPLLRQVLRLSPSPDTQNPSAREVHSFSSVTSALAREIAGKSADLTLTVETVLLRPTLSSEVTLQAKASSHGERGTLRVLKVDIDPSGGLDVGMVEVSPARNSAKTERRDWIMVDRSADRLARFLEYRGEQISIAGVNIMSHFATLRPETTTREIRDTLLSEPQRFQVARVSYDRVDHIVLVDEASQITVR